MLLDASGKIAVKCSRCGRYDDFNINIFNLISKNDFKCSCNEHLFTAYVEKGNIIINIRCIACERQHIYRFKIREIMQKPLNIISCPNTGMEIGFLGRNEKVDEFVNRYMGDMYELLKSLGVVDDEIKSLVK